MAAGMALDRDPERRRRLGGPPYGSSANEGGILAVEAADKSSGVLAALGRGLRRLLALLVGNPSEPVLPDTTFTARVDPEWTKAVAEEFRQQRTSDGSLITLVG